MKYQKNKWKSKFKVKEIVESLFTSQILVYQIEEKILVT